MHLNGERLQSIMIQTKELTDEAVVERMRAGEVELFELIMRRHNQKLYRIARGMGIDDAECDDVIQQCYINAYSRLAQFQGTSSFSTWLVRILINECLMSKRKSKAAVTSSGELHGFDDLPIEFEEDAVTPESEMIRNEVRRVVEEAIEKLPGDYRVVYVMREMETMSIKEIASALDLTEVNVKVRLLRARTKLRNSLKSYLSPSEIYEFGNSRCDGIVRSVLANVSRA
jgi:RNA polymerase sigma-70 factor (ECF subfamily)